MPMKKWLAPIVLAALALSGPAAAQQFATGQAARLVIGQKPFGAGDPGASDVLLGALNGVAYGGNTLVVADSNRVGALPNNNRVLVYRDLSSQVLSPYDAFPQNDTRCPACIGKATSVLGQPDFAKVDFPRAIAQSTLNRPLGVAYNGRMLAVADTDNNRVLIWRSLPTSNEAPADFVVGHADFTRGAATRALTSRTLRGPQGVWLDDADGLWVADTQNSRILFYGVVTQNNPDAKLVLGQKDFNSDQQTSLALVPVARADTMRHPVSVSTDGRRLFVADLGLSRVLIWNTIPTQNGKAADVVVGQPDMTSYLSNNVEKLCQSTGTGADGNAAYPALCGRSMSMPRFALSDGQRLYVSDSGNDRVLVYNSIPSGNGFAADAVLGQQGDALNQASDSAEPDRVASTDSFRTPGALAWDGANLYVADAFNRRVLLYTPADYHLPLTAVRNAASPEVFAQGYIVVAGTLKAKEKATIKIGDNSVEGSEKSYTVTVAEDDTIRALIDRLIAAINGGGGDPLALASPNYDFNAIMFQARNAGPPGNNVSLAASLDPASSLTTLTTSGTTLLGGNDAARVAPFGLVTILGENLADFTSAVQPLDRPLPYKLVNTEVFFDGVRAPLILVAPDRVVCQLPVVMTGSTSASAIIRTVRADGRVTVTTPAAVRVIEQNPSVFSDPSLPPAPGIAYHFSSAATGTISVDGTAQPGDEASIFIRDRKYAYRVQAGDTTASIRDGLIALINAADPEVEAFGSGTFARVRLRAKIPGPIGNGIPISGKSSDGASGSVIDGSVIISAFNTELCCANEAGAQVTVDNPAVPGETIVVLAAGMGLVGPDEARDAMKTGMPYAGPDLNDVTEFANSMAGGKTANVLFAGLVKGLVGVYEVHLELNTDIPTNPRTPAWVAQSFQISNYFYIPVVNPRLAQ
ncbi:MAG: hypothetical protein C0504_11565 [Candidatus Solibacter sp.]|nr:hypothetical protein [Candidatus Solibacter sp.]